MVEESKLTKMKAYTERVLVELVEVEEETKSLIALEDKTLYKRAKVISVGETAEGYLAISPKEGEEVLLDGAAQGIPIRDQGKIYYLYRRQHILVIL